MSKKTECLYKEADGSCTHPSDNRSCGDHCVPKAEPGSVAVYTCYQCLESVGYLFDDGRCKDCTRMTTEEVQGMVGPDCCPKCLDEDCTGWCDSE